VITPRLFAVAVHALLHHYPASVVSNDEAVQIKFKPVLYRGAIDLRHQPTRGSELAAVKADTLADRDKFVRRLTRMLAASAADAQTELMIERRQPALERAEHARGDARRVPVHSHHGAEGLKPEWMGETAQKFVPPIMMDDGLAYHCAKPRHPVGQPFRHVSVMQRQIGTSGSSDHFGSGLTGANALQCSYFVPRRRNVKPSLKPPLYGHRELRAERVASGRSRGL